MTSFQDRLQRRMSAAKQLGIEMRTEQLTEFTMWLRDGFYIHEDFTDEALGELVDRYLQEQMSYSPLAYWRLGTPMHPRRQALHDRYPWLNAQPQVPFPDLEPSRFDEWVVWFTDKTRKLNFWLQSRGL